MLKNFGEFPRLDQRYVCGDHQRALDAALDAEVSSHLNGAGFSGIVWVGDNFELIFGSQV